MDMDTLLCLTWRTSEDLLGSTGKSAPCHVATWVGGAFGGERKCDIESVCLTLCDPTDCSPPGSSVHGILQARMLQWLAMSFSPSTK